MTTANLALTDTDDPYSAAICTPIAEFSYNREMICEGATVTFTDDSWNATPTSWNWTFTGGTPNTSASQNPTITYNTAGVYDVTHRPTTTAGTDVITKSSIITVNSLTADYNSPVTDGFENSTQFNNDWTFNGSDNFNWTRTGAAASTGSSSVTITNFAASSGDVDELISPSYDLSASSGKQVKFKVAYANKSGTTADKLFVYYSLNCGQSWSLKKPFVNALLTTAPNHSNSFVPTSAEWTEHLMDFTGNGSATNFRLKFEFTGDGGNNIYIDDINIGGHVGVDEFSNVGNFSVYPNPTNASAKISFSLLEDVDNLRVTVKNSLGQEVTSIINGASFNVGKYTLNIDEQEILSSGIYFVEFNADNNIIMKKLIVQ
jgi:PKD repeat protein